MRTCDLPDLAAALRRVVGVEVSRCLRKEAAEALRAARRPTWFVQWVDDFYDRHGAMVAETVAPGLDAWEAAFGGATAGWRAGWVEAHVERSRSELLAAAEVPAPLLPASVERAVSRWGSSRVLEVVAGLPG